MQFDELGVSALIDPVFSPRLYGGWVRRFAAIWACSCLGLVVGEPASAFVQVELEDVSGSSSAAVRWNLDLFSSGIPYVIRTTAIGEGTPDIGGVAEFDIIRKAFQNWQNVPSSRISYKDSGSTPRFLPGKVDNINAVGFANDDKLARAGVGALTFLTVRTANNGQRGEIKEADVLLVDSPSIQWLAQGNHRLSKNPDSPIKLNLEEVATREVGHFNGLSASFVRYPYENPLLTVEDRSIIEDGRGGPFQETALMYPFALNGSPAAADGSLLSLDDAAAVSVLYPSPSSANTTGAISGTITLRDTETEEIKALPGAHVMAVDPGSYHPVAGTVSRGDGSYRLQGLETGNYLVWVEPGSPPDLQDVSEDIDPASMGFISEFYNNVYYHSKSNAAQVSVLAGQTTTGVSVEVLKTIKNREFVYAEGNQRDAEGNRLLIKIEPDDNQDEATRLEDTDDDGEIRISDRIQIAGDADFYFFTATRDDVIQVEVIARRDGSPMDPLLNLFGPGIGQAIPFASADDTPGIAPDARLVFTAPETNRYFVEVRDADGLGGPDFTYTLVITKLSERVPITPLGGPVAVLSIPISDADLQAAGFLDPNTFGNVDITALRVQFLDVDGDAGLDTDGSDFLPPTREPLAGIGAPESGFLLFNDDGTVPGIFDFDSNSPSFPEQDNSLRMREAPTIRPIEFGFEVTFVPETPFRIPAQHIQDEIADLHVVVQPSLLLHHQDDFQVIVPANGIELRVNTVAGPRRVTMFQQNFPPVLERDKFTGDIVEFTSFLPLAGGIIDANSTDFPVIGLNLIGDPEERYWVSEIELSFVGYSLHNIIPFVPGLQFFGFFDFFYRGPDLENPRRFQRTWTMTDLQPLTIGDELSGGVNIYVDNDALGAIGDGVPNFGLDGDVLVSLNGAQRFERLELDSISTETLRELVPRALQEFVDLEFLLDNRNELNIFAFKAILPLQPNPILRVPSSDDESQGTIGSDMFVSIRTSNTVEAIDLFVPFVQIGGVEIKSNLDDVIQRGDPSLSSLVNGGSLRLINTTSKPNTTLVEVRPNAGLVIKDMVNPQDPTNRGNTIGTFAQGSPPLAVLGLDFQDHGGGAMTSPNPVLLGGEDLLNTGVVLDSITIILDPVDRPEVIPFNFLKEVTVLDETMGTMPAISQTDPDLIDLPLRGIEILVDDDTPQGDLLDNDGDGLVDEELLNDEDDDLDGITDELDFGDGDIAGINGQLDPNDDVVAYLQLHDPDRLGEVTVIPGEGRASYFAAPIVTSLGNGSLQVEYPDLTANVTETDGAFGLAFGEPLSIFIDAVFVRVDHRVIIADPPDFPVYPITLNKGEVFEIFQHGFIVDFGDDLQPLFDDPPLLIWDYFYRTQIPNSNAIPRLQGPDFFVSARLGPAAISGDSFRVRIPPNGVNFSFYRDPQPFENFIRPASAPATPFISSRIQVGTTNVPPALRFIEPGVGQNAARAVLVDEPLVPGGPNVERVEFEFEVEFTFNDPDNTASVDFFFDTDNVGVDGKPIPFVAGQQTTNILDNDGQNELVITFRFPPELLNNPNASVFIYGIVDDGINPPEAVYSDGEIVLPESERDRFETEEFILADNIGRIFGTGNANVNIPDFRQPFNNIRDVELTPTQRGALYLQANGGVVLRGDPDPWRDFVRTSNTVTFPESPRVEFAMDLARDIEPDFIRNGYYLLDAFGAVFALGNVPPAGLDLSAAPQFGMDIARDMELTPTRQGLLILDGFGATHALGDAPRPGGQPFFGFDIARDVALTVTGDGFYLLDGFGGIFPMGDAQVFEATDFEDFLYVPGSDIYRAIERVPALDDPLRQDEGIRDALLVMDRGGQVRRVGDIILGPNPIPAGAIPPPVGFRDGDLIDFSRLGPNANVVVSEVNGAFIDLEGTGLRQLERGAEEVIGVGPGRRGLCRFIREENLQGLLSLFARPGQLTQPGLEDGFVDAQGHDLGDVAQVWSAFFDFFRPIACFVPSSSFTVVANPQVENGVIASGSIELVVLTPTLRILGPSDDPRELEEDPGDFDGQDEFFNRGEIFELFPNNPVPFSHVARFFEIADGRGWRMNIWENRNEVDENRISPADRLIAFRNFFKRFQHRRKEGAGEIFIEEIEDPSLISVNEYLVQFIEELEASATNPQGGWNQPIVVFQVFDVIDDEVPFDIFTIPFEFEIFTDPETGVGIITGGECALWGTLPARSDADVIEFDQNSSINEEILGPAGWRFRDPLGIVADPRFEEFFEAQLYLSDGADLLEIPDQFSSANVINLSSLLNIEEIEKQGPPVVDAPDDVPLVPLSRFLEGGFTVTPAFGQFSDVVPLPDDLRIEPEDVEDILSTGFFFEDEFEEIDVVDSEGTNIATAFTDDFLITFSRADQQGLPSPDTRLYFATIRVKSIRAEDEPNSQGNIVFTFRFDPDTDFIDFNAFKGRADAPESGGSAEEGSVSRPILKTSAD